MKYLVLFAVLAVVYMAWRSQRQASAKSTEAKTASPTLPQEMVRCADCGLHLPREEALEDPGGRLFCSTQHRDRYLG